MFANIFKFGWAYFQLDLIGRFYFNVNITYTSRVISTLHSILAVVGSSLYLWTGNDDILALLYGNSIGYCLYDMKNVIAEKSTAMIIHHIVFMVGIIFYGYKYVREVSLFLLTEISTVFLNIAWYLHKTGQRNTRRYKITAISLLTSYFLFRIVLVSFIVYRIYILRCISCVPVVLTLLALNVVWFYKLCGMAKKNLCS